MMKVSDILANADETLFSIEVFPPKVAYSKGSTPIQQHLSNIFETVEHLSKYDPAFVSVTYNPEGETRATSIPLAAIFKQRYGIESVAHLTCIATPRSEVAKTLDVLDYFDIDNILALRGDRPECGIPAMAEGECMEYAYELVEEINNHDHDFCIGVAGYPEGHPECLGEDSCRDIDGDLENFIHKVDKGVGFSITQLFLDNDHFFEYVARVRSAGVEIPIIPGIMPVINMSIIDIVEGLCGAAIPDDLRRRLVDNAEDPDEIRAIGIDHAIDQCKGLMGKVPCIHFYTMDMWRPVEAIIEAIR